MPNIKWIVGAWVTLGTSGAIGEIVFCQTEAYPNRYQKGLLSKENAPCAVVYGGNGRLELVEESDLAEPKTPVGGTTPSTRYSFVKLQVKARDLTCRRVQFTASLGNSYLIPCRAEKMVVETPGSRPWQVGDIALARPTATPGYASVSDEFLQVKITELTSCLGVRWDNPDSESFYSLGKLPQEVKWIEHKKKIAAGLGVQRQVDCECDSGDEKFQTGKFLGKLDCVKASTVDSNGVTSQSLYAKDWLLHFADLPKSIQSDLPRK